MKKIGIIGGLSWQSTVDYYKIINEESNRRLGKKSTVEQIIWSTDLEKKFNHVINGELDVLADEFAEIAEGLEKAGADCVIMATNTMHLVFDKVCESVSIPMIHIADPTAEAIRRAGFNKIALLGTSFTCTHPFYMGRLKEKFGIECLVPTEDEKIEIQRVIEEELTFNIIKDTSRDYYLKVINELARKGAQGVILGCTEIQMLIKQEDTDLPVFDTTTLHALAAVNFAMGE